MPTYIEYMAFTGPELVEEHSDPDMGSEPDVLLSAFTDMHFSDKDHLSDNSDFEASSSASSSSEGEAEEDDM